MLQKTIFISSIIILSFTNVVNATTDTWFANDDGTVTDVATGLIWQQEDDDITRNYDDAITYCEDLSLAGESDWRLPYAKELTTIVDYKTSDPAIDDADFIGTNFLFPARYWTSSDNTNLGGNGVAMSFERGTVSTDSMGTLYYARCVRN